MTWFVKKRVDEESKISGSAGGTPLTMVEHDTSRLTGPLHKQHIWWSVKKKIMCKFVRRPTVSPIPPSYSVMHCL